MKANLPGAVNYREEDEEEMVVMLVVALVAGSSYLKLVRIYICAAAFDRLGRRRSTCCLLAVGDAMEIGE